jgi:hypothetical protein
MRTISWIAVEPRLARSARNSSGQPLTCSTVPTKTGSESQVSSRLQSPDTVPKIANFSSLIGEDWRSQGLADCAGAGCRPAMIDRTTSLGVGCFRGGQVCKPGGRPYADAHDSLLAENVNSLSLCRLNLRPKNPEGCQPAYQTTRLPLYDTNGSCTPYLNFSFIT